MTDAADQLVTARHESGHAAMSYILHSPLTVVSIRRSAHFSGMVIHAPMGSLRGQNLDLLCFGPTVLQPARVRTAFETRVMIALAGPAAAFSFSERMEGYLGTDPDEAEAGRAVREFVGAPTARELKRLEEAEEDESIDADEETAMKWSRALAGEAGIAYLHFLRVQTDIAIRSVTFGRLMDALVPILLEKEVVSGRAVRKLFDEVAGRRQPPVDIAASK